MALVGIGSIYLYQEKFTQAVEYLEPGLKIAREMKDRRSEKRALLNLSVVYANIGAADKAIPYAQALLAIAKQENDRSLQGVALQGLGVAEALKRNYRQAIPYYEQSLNAFRQTKDSEREAFVLSALGEVYIQLGETDKGAVYLEQSRAVSQKAPKPTQVPQGQSEEVTKLLAIQPTDSWNVVVGKAISSRQLGRIDEAIASFARYGEMFKATDPTAKQYSRVAQAFIQQMRSLNVKGGVYIYQLVVGSAAAQKGLAVGDIIVSLNGQPISTMTEFVAVRDRATKNKPLEIDYLRLEGKQFRRYSATVNNQMGAALMPI